MKKDKAIEIFDSGFNCAQSVVTALAKEHGIDESTALKVASGLGGGLGGKQYVCGAVNGGAIILGLKYGISSFAEKESNGESRAVVAKFMEHLEKKYGKLNCLSLVDVNFNDEEAVAKAREEGKFQICRKVISDVCEFIDSKNK